MKRLLMRMRHEDAGVLTFEWILLITVLTIGVVGGLSGARDAIIDELGDVAEAMVSLDQSYTILQPVEIAVHDGLLDGASDSRFVDEKTYTQCRPGIPGAIDLTGGEPSNLTGS